MVVGASLELVFTHRGLVLLQGGAERMGTVTTSHEVQRIVEGMDAAFVDIGANMLIHSSDLGLFSTHLRTELSEIKRRVGVESDSAGTDQINI